METAPIDWRRSIRRVALCVLAFAVMPEAFAATPEDIGRTAESFLGVPYNWGGTSKEGFDCSGFVGKVYAENGYVLPRVSHQQARVGLVVPAFALEKGDLLFFTQSPGSGPVNHVALYMKDDSFIHASVGSNAVRYDTLQGTYFKHRFAGARRILGMPPGRYATLAGTAPDGVLFATAADQTRFMALSAEERGKLVGGTPASGPVPGLESEHAAESRPWLVAVEPPVSVPLTEVGPARLERERTGLGLSGGWLLANRGNFFVVQPVGRYVGEATSVRVDLGATWAFPVDGGAQNPLAWGPWDAARTWGRFLRTLALGQPNATFELHLERTWSATLGSGQLMHRFTPNIGTTGPADLVVEQSALTLAGSTTQDTFGLQWVLDDVFSPAVGGARVWWGPAIGSVGSHGVWGATRLSLAWAGDFSAPAATATGSAAPGTTSAATTPVFNARQVHGFGVSLDTPWYKSATQLLSSMVDASTLLHPGVHGWGLAGALKWEAQGLGMSQLRGHLRMELRAGQGSFVPGYFDVLYASSRAFAPVQPAPIPPATPTRLDWLDSLNGAPWHWSLAAEGQLQVYHRATVGLSYEDGESLTTLVGTYTPRSLMLFLRLDPLFEDPSGQSSGVYLALHLRNVSDLSDAGWRAYLYVAARHDLNRWLGIQAVVRHGLQGDTGQVQTDVMGGLNINFDL